MLTQNWVLLMKNVLFLCTGNSCRSILAEGILSHYGKGKYQAYSAGSFPTGNVHPVALETLRNNGIELSNLRSKSWDEFKNKQIDLLVTVCDNAEGEVCPIFLGKPAKLHWGMPDPAHFEGTEAEISAEFQRVYKMLEKQIVKWLAENG